MKQNRSSSISKGMIKPWMLLVSLLTVVGLLLAACGGSSSDTGNNSSKKRVLTIGAHVGGDFTQAFSPYNPTQVNEGIQGMVYETLLFFNRNDGSVTPWLASEYKWSSDQKTLTFTLRENVKWNDGKPFSAEDVAFTFNMLKQYPAADTKGLWADLASVTAPDAKTAVFTFKNANPPLLWYLGGQTYIVPKHIFEGQDPTKFANEKPVGTGPFKVKKFAPQLLTYEKNADYWQKDKLQIDELRYPAVKDNQTLQLKLISGEIDWGSFYAPDLDTSYKAKDPNNNFYWMAPTDIFTLYVNLTKAPFNDVAVRQAISTAIDRTQLSKQAESGYVDPASTTGLILPNAKAYLDPNYSTVQTTADKAKAGQILEKAGYKKGGDGFYAKDGKKLSFSIKVVNGWTDWEVMASVLKQNLKDAGIDASVDSIQDSAYFDARNNGNFDALIGGLFGGPTPFYLYNTHLNSANLSPKGFNWGKWNDKETDALLKKYTSTTDESVQKDAIMGLQKIYAEKLPNIPLVNAASWYEYTTKNFTGWPSKENPYAVGAAYSAPDNVVIVLNLKPKN